MTRVAIAAALLLLLCMQGARGAESYTANDLYEVCRESQLTCAFFALGWQNGYLARDWEDTSMGGREPMNVAPRTEGAVSQSLVCFPAAVSPRQLGDVVWKHLELRPGQRDMPAWLFVWAAFVKEWPC